MSTQKTMSACFPISQALAELIKPEAKLELFMPFISDEKEGGIGEAYGAKFDAVSFFYKAPSKIDGLWVLYDETRIDFNMINDIPNTCFRTTEELKFVLGEPKFKMELRGIYARFKIRLNNDGKINEIEQAVNFGQFFSTQKEIIFLSLRASIAFNTALLSSSS